MFHFSFHHQHQNRRVLIVSVLAMLVALLVTWTTRSHAYEFTEFDKQQAMQPYQQREQVREQYQDQQVTQRNAQHLQEWKTYTPQFDPRRFDGPQPFNVIDGQGHMSTCRRGYNGAIFCQ